MTSIESSEEACRNCGMSNSSALANGLCPSCRLSVSGENLQGTDGRLVDDLDATLDTGVLDSARIDGSPPAASPLRNGNDLPKSFGDYTLQNEIARGGMGVVYRARHQKLGREVALKVILSGQFASASDLRRFELEAESAASLDHPGIVPIYEIGKDQGHHYFTMKLIEGGSLAKHIAELSRQLSEFVSVVAQVAEAIDYAHRRGILHRDIKPANILLDNEGRPYVTDLGLAKKTGVDSDLTGSGAIVGTPAYMPPEQASANKEITTSADIYAIGAILYEGLTGRPPHIGDSPFQILMRAAQGDIQPPSTLNRQCDRVLELICMKCLSRDPGDRYSSCSLLAKDLRSWLAGEAVSVRPKSFVSVFSDLITDQMRSALGAVLIGILGGIITGLPLYCSLALGLFGRSDSKFNVARLQREMPGFKSAHAWWLHPPDWMANQGFLLSLLVSLFLGMIIQQLVRPKGLRQAMAVGLVAGLLMTIVQFSLYGIGASWQTFSLVNAQQIDWLAEASLAPEPGRQLAVDRLNAAFPDLANADPNVRADLMSKAISVSIMLASPATFLGTLCVCLAFSTVYCVAGTVLCNRLWDEPLTSLAIVVRYLEVMLLSTFALVTFAFIVFYCFGMVTNEHGVVKLPKTLIAVLALWIIATVPGWKMQRWYIRWPTYVVCVAAAISLTGMIAR